MTLVRKLSKTRIPTRSNSRSDTSGPHASATRAPSTRAPLVLLAVSISGVLAGLDGTAVVIAAPNIARDVGATAEQLRWITNAYLVALAIGLLPAGRLADKLGHRRIFVMGALLFGLISLPIGLARDAGELIVLRALQGFAGALMQPTALALLRACFPRDRLKPAIGVLTAATAGAAAFGPMVAGVIVREFGWPVVFLVNLPVALLAAVLARWFAAEYRTRANSGRAGPHIRNLFRLPGVAAGVLMVLAGFFTIYGVLFLLTLYLQNLRGFGPVTAGAWMLPLSVIVVFSAPMGGLLTARYGNKLPGTIGLALLLCAMLGMSTLGTDSGFAGFAGYGLLAGLGAGVVLVAGTEAIVGAAPVSASGTASAIQQMLGQLGGVLGITTLGAMLTARSTTALPARLAQNRVDHTVIEYALNRAETVGQGLVPVPPRADEQLAANLTHASHQAFLTGLSGALLVSASIAAGACLLNLLLPAPETARPGDAGPEGAGAEESGDGRRARHEHVGRCIEPRDGLRVAIRSNVEEHPGTTP